MPVGTFEEVSKNLSLSVRCYKTNLQVLLRSEENVPSRYLTYIPRALFVIVLSMSS